ncbi:MAG: immunoglobulin domain-containing protein [Verrucomicrobiota bacterium]
MIKTLCTLGATVVIGFIGLVPAVASISITSSGTTSGSTYALNGGAYVQSFDSLPASGTFTWSNDTTLPGWYAADGAGGLNSAGKTINGTGTNPDDLTLSNVGAAGSNERALAYHTRLVTAPSHLGIAFINNTGSEITSFSLAYSAEQWKEGTNMRTVTAAVQYKVGATSADLHASGGWTTLPSLGFSTLNGTAPNSTSLSAAGIPVSIANGTSLWVRWVFTNNATTSTTSHDILAVDNVTFSAGTGTPVDPSPVITTHPSDQNVTAGGSATFSVAASGAAPLAYQWFKGVDPISGATLPDYTIDTVAAADAGTYSVTVTHAASSVTSDSATLTVVAGSTGAPTIVASPVSITRMLGGGAMFKATFSGSEPMTYAWFKNDVIVPDATGNKLTLAGLTANDAGAYRVTATNSHGSASSATATVSTTNSLPDSTFNLYGFAAQPIYPGVPSNTYSPATTTGGGVIPETDTAYRKVSTPLEFAQALGAANKGQGVKVIEIMNDLDLGWNEIGTAVQTAINTPFVAAVAPKLHPKLLTSGVSTIYINPKNGGLTIFSANGSAIRHCIWGVKSTANIIIRNLKFDELWEWDEDSRGDYDNNNWDFITLSVGGGTVDHVWIDHCTFTKSYDGIVDNKGGVSNVTHSWNKYEGDDGATNSNSFVRQQINLLEANMSAHPMYDFLRTRGFSVEDIVEILQGPDKTTAIGELSLNAENVNSSITFHHQWYINTWDRLPRLAGGTAHNYNIYVDDTLVQAAKRMRNARFNAMNSADQATFTNNYNFNPPINGSISTEDGALLVEKSVYIDCNWPLRNNQTNPSNPIYTGKIKATDTIYIYHNTDGTTTNVRGNSTDPGNPLGPFQATIKTFSWNTPDGNAPYTLPPSAYHDPAVLGEIVAAGAGAGVLTWHKSNWLKTSYADPATDTFAAWSARNGITGPDSDGDGIADLMEFGLGLNPQQPSMQGLPTLSQAAGQRVFRFTRPNNLSGLTYTVQTSTDLEEWSGTLPVTVESSTATTETLVASLPTGQPKLLVRLRVHQP